MTDTAHPNEVVPPSTFDHDATYENEIKPLLELIRRICHHNKIPFLFSCCYAVTQEEKEYRLSFATAGCVGENGWVPLELILSRMIVMGGAAKVVPVMGDPSETSELVGRIEAAIGKAAAHYQENQRQIAQN